MAEKHQLSILRKGVKNWNDWRRKEREKSSEAWEQYWEEHSEVIAESDGPYYFPDEPDEKELESEKVNLEQADLSGANLENVDFSGGNLQGAKFIDAKLMSADFRGSNLNYANFSNANLTYVDFRGAYINNTIFDSAIIVGTLFDSSGLSQIKGLPSISITINNELHKQTKLYYTQRQPRLKVFLCYSSDDRGFAKTLYNKLYNAGIEPWLDVENLLPGQVWEVEIKKEVSVSHVVIVCLSNISINKKGYVQKEIIMALDEADRQPERSIYLIPLKIEDCKIPERLSHLHWVNFYEEQGFDRMMRSLRKRASDLEIII